jgi:hypothetical protein
LILVCAFAAGLNILYVARDRTPQHWDSSNHLRLSMTYGDRIASSGFAEISKIWTTEYEFYPPGFHLANVPAFSLLGHTIEAGLVWQSLYLVLTLVSLYLLVAHYYGSLNGALGAAVYACFPIVLGFSRMAFIENLLALQITSVVLLAMPLRALERPFLAVLLGLVVGYGQMTKWQFVLYVLPLLAIVWVIGLRRARRLTAPEGRAPEARLLLCAGLSGIVAIAVSAPWYVLHFDEILRDLRFHAFEREMGDAPLLSAPALLYYVQAFPWQMIGLPISCVLFFAIGNSFVRRRSEPQRFVWTLAVLASAFILTWSKHKEGRFLLPILPLFTAILVGAIATARKGIRLASCAVLLLFSPLNAAAQTFTLGPRLDSVTVPIGLDRRGFIVRRGSPEWLLWPIQRQNWAYNEIFREIRAISKETGGAPCIHFCMEQDHPYFNLVTFWSQVIARRLRETRTHEEANFCISHGAGLAEGDGPTSDPAFVPVRTWELPDGTAVRLFRRP